MYHVGVESPFPMVTVDEALQIITDVSPRTLGTETVELSIALNAVAAADVVCPHDLPQFHATIVDGFAIAEKPNVDLAGEDLQVSDMTHAIQSDL